MKYFITILIILAIWACNLKTRTNNGQKPTIHSNGINILTGDSLSKIYTENKTRNQIVNNYEFSLAETFDNGDFIRYKEIADDYFHNNKIDKALNLYEYVTSSMLIEPLWFETAYQIVECHIVNNDYQLAIDYVKQILNFDNIPIDIYEKTLVRAGQIECILDNKTNSSQYFIELRKKFPKSIYIPLADCNKLKI